MTLELFTSLNGVRVFSLDFSPSERRLREAIREFLLDEVPATWVGIWHQPDAPQIAQMLTKKLAEKGWLTYHWPREYGGSEGSSWEQAVIQEELFARHEPRGGQYMGVNWIGPAIMTFGSDVQKRQYLPEIARGDVQWAQLFSEPGAGSDLAAVSTRAEPQEDGSFRITGEKIWTSYANIAQRGFLLARTSSQGDRHSGLSIFLFNLDCPGITIREIPSSVGNHRFHSVHFDDVVLPASSLLGPLHEGWSVAMSSLPLERVGNARYARVTRALRLLSERILTKASTDSKETCGFQNQLLDTLAMGRMAELLNHFVVDLKDRGTMPGWEASEAFASNALYEKRAAFLIEDSTGFDCLISVEDEHAICNGELESFTARQAPTVMIQAGTYQVQLTLVAKQALRLPKAS
jgi:alkylation response protein AidB-like acyl-CoA dehydrogenase